MVEGQKSVSKGVLLAGSMDLLAKAEAQGFTHHKGKCGCPFCLNPGENVSTESKKKNSHVHVYAANPIHPDRTIQETVKHARKAYESGEPVWTISFFSFFLRLDKKKYLIFSIGVRCSISLDSLVICIF